MISLSVCLSLLFRSFPITSQCPSEKIWTLFQVFSLSSVLTPHHFLITSRCLCPLNAEEESVPSVVLKVRVNLRVRLFSGLDFSKDQSQKPLSSEPKAPPPPPSTIVKGGTTRSSLFKEGYQNKRLQKAQAIQGQSKEREPSTKHAPLYPQPDAGRKAIFGSSARIGRDWADVSELSLSGVAIHFRLYPADVGPTSEHDLPALRNRVCPCVLILELPYLFL